MYNSSFSDDKFKHVRLILNDKLFQKQDLIRLIMHAEDSCWLQIITIASSDYTNLKRTY